MCIGIVRLESDRFIGRGNSLFVLPLQLQGQSESHVRPTEGFIDIDCLAGQRQCPCGGFAGVAR